MKFGSCFTGIGGFDLGLERAGMECAWQVEKDKRCRRILGRHWPDVPLFDDMESFSATSIPVRPDWICGGFPCQDISVAGQRAGLRGGRSGLFFEFIRVIAEFAPAGVLIENVPGLLSSGERRDMGTVLGRLGQLGYGWAYRVLDAQWFGVAQQRRRVFIVGHLGGMRRAAEILFEPESLPWDSPPSREAGARVAHAIAAGAGGSKFGSGRAGQDDFITAGPLMAHAKEHGHAMTTQQAAESGQLVAELRAEDPNGTEDGPGCETPLVAVPFSFQTRIARNGRGQPMDTVAALCASEGGTHADAKPHVATRNGVRRLMPIECERLQGFPDGWTEGESDSGRYHVLGNAVAVPVAEWIGRRALDFAAKNN